MRHNALRVATQRLAAAGIPCARREAESLLAAVLGCQPLEVYIAPEPNGAQSRRFEHWVTARTRHEPAQYLTGAARFWGRAFAVNRDTLIPRPETELLVEEAVRHVRRQWPAATPIRAVDVGTGCGNLAVSLTRELRSVTMVGIDRSLPALMVARRNAERHGVAAQVHFLQGDGLTAVDCRWAPHLIVANPPYIPSSALSDLPPEVQREPCEALDGGAEGLRVYTAWIPEAARCVRAGGLLVLEVGCGQDQAVRAMIAAVPAWQLRNVRTDWNDIPRVVVAQKRIDG